jgi:hypothetical protein
VPYAVLVSALGAIVSTAIALFGLHTWSAMKIAPVVGAVVGFIFAVASLRRYGLSLDAGLEEYRDAAGVRSLKHVSLRYLSVAFGAAAVVSVIELPFVLIGQATALSVCAAGWVTIIGYTLYRAWQIDDPTSYGNLDAFQIVGGVLSLSFFGAILCGVFIYVQAGMLTQTIPGFELVRMILLFNSCAALEAMVVAVFALNMVRRVAGMINPWQR